MSDPTPSEVKKPFPFTCPFCHAGHWQETGTAGRLSCSNCASIALDGRAKIATAIEEVKE